MTQQKSLDEQLDRALEESFPASDSPTVFGDTADEEDAEEEDDEDEDEDEDDEEDEEADEDDED